MAAALSSIWRVGQDPWPKHERPYWTLFHNSSDEAAIELDQQQAQAQQDNDDDDDFAPLILTSNKGCSRHQHEDKTGDDSDDDEKDNSTAKNDPTRDGNQLRRLPSSRLFVVMSAALLLPFAVVLMSRKNDMITGERTNESSLTQNATSKSSLLPQYSCPISPTQESPEFNPDEPQLYTGQDAMILDNITSYVEHYRDSDFDQWGNTYNDFKQNRSNFITRRFGPYLQNGSSIYESACGIGMNLALTLEVLYESSYAITGLVVYGNDFVPDSIAVANALLAAEKGGILLPANSQIGKLCHGDPMDLSHVPSNAFDLVYTGYVTPLQNPLELNLGSTRETQRYYKHIVCGTSDGDRSKQHSAAAMQEKQEAWFGAWVGEMVRIAKPGVPVIVEGVSHSLCVAPNDWGGVEVEFWYSAVEKYGWDINVESIEMEPDLMDSSRYHVFMRKKSSQDDAHAP
jgi:SAM-dependent methyltransferase